MMNDLETIFKALSIVGGALAWLYQWRNLRFRSNLKADLEILRSLESLGSEERNYKILKAHIDSTIVQAYSSSHTKNVNKERKFDYIFSGIFLILSILWTIYAAKDEFMWWEVLIASFFAIVCISALFDGIIRKQTHKSLKQL